MTTQQISEQVRQLILEGELDDAANALVQFFDKEWMSRGDKEQVQLYNQALYQLSQLNELKHQVFAGIISNEDADLKRNKIRAVLLEVSEALKNMQSRPVVAAQPERTQPDAVATKGESRRWIWGLFALLTISIIGLLIYRQTNQGAIPETQTIVQKDTVFISGNTDAASPSTVEQKPPESQPGRQETRPKNTTGAVTPPPPVGKAELYVQFDIQPSTLISDQSARVTVTVHNSGQKAANQVTTYWWATPNISPKTLIFDRIAAGGRESQSFDFTWYQMEGQVLVKAQVDPQNRIAEGNEANNSFSKNMIVTAPNVGSGTASITEKTELVAMIKAPSKIKMGQAVTIEVVATNKSRTVAADNFEVWWWADKNDSSPFHKFKVDHLEPQKAKSFTFTFSWINVLQTTEVMMVAKVDPLEKVSELNETNNSGQQAIRVEK